MFNICAIPAITLPSYYSSLQHVNGRENYGISISTGRNVHGFSDHVYEEFSSDGYAQVSNQTYVGHHEPSHMHALSYHQLYIKLFIILLCLLYYNIIISAVYTVLYWNYCQERTYGLLAVLCSNAARRK